jgi:hypothetical protein
MNIKPLKAQQVVDTFLRSKSTVPGEMLEDVAKHLCEKHRMRYSICDLVSRLRKARSGNRLFEYRKDGQNFYETKEARRVRCGLSKFASLADYINATEVEPALA